MYREQKTMCKDNYRNFAALKQGEGAENYAIQLRPGRSGVAIIAPHGGGIEPGTLEIASRVAGEEHSFYGFEGHKSRENKDLHITSTHFDEPQCLDIVRASTTVIAIHGCCGVQENVYMGGRDEPLKDHLSRRLEAAGFIVMPHPDVNLQGSFESNICNRGFTRKGVQLELEEGLRRTMFAGLNRHQRRHTTGVFTRFVEALRQALRELS
jgi:phage replication-related protein YjqB (UPF0714/DUF867 family)